MRSHAQQTDSEAFGETEKPVTWTDKTAQNQLHHYWRLRYREHLLCLLLFLSMSSCLVEGHLIWESLLPVLTTIRNSHRFRVECRRFRCHRTETKYSQISTGESQFRLRGTYQCLSFYVYECVMNASTLPVVTHYSHRKCNSMQCRNIQRPHF